MRPGAPGFDPFEEQFDLPAALVQLRNRQRRKVEVVGQKHEPLARFVVHIGHATQRVGILLGGLGAAQDNGLIAPQSRRSVHGSGATAGKVEIALRANHEEGQRLSEAMETSEVSEDAPVPGFVGIGHGAPRHVAADAGVIELGLHGPQTGFDIPQAFAIGQLSESHAQKLVEAGESSDSVVAGIPPHAAVEFVSGQEVHELSEDDLSSVHRPCLSAKIAAYHSRNRVAS